MGLWVVARDGTGLRQVVPNEYIHSVAWLPGGDGLLFLQGHNHTIDTVDVTGANRKVVFSPGWPAQAMTLSPNGRLIALSSWNAIPCPGGIPKMDIYLLDFDPVDRVASNLRLLRADPCGSHVPRVFAPENDSLIATSGWDAGPLRGEIRMIALDGTVRWGIPSGSTGDDAWLFSEGRTRVILDSGYIDLPTRTLVNVTVTPSE